MNEIIPKTVKKRRRRRRALISCFIGLFGITILSIIAFSLVYVDRFTVTVNDANLCLTIDENKVERATLLHAPPVLQAFDTQYSEIPQNIDDELGSKNTDHYFAYSFYLGGLGNYESINYELSMRLTQTTQDISDAMRVMIIRNEERTVYAKADENGQPKPIYDNVDRLGEPTIIGTTVPFEENTHIIHRPYNVLPNEFDRYTIVMWIDGWESVDSMRGGLFQAQIKFSTISTIIEEN